MFDFLISLRNFRKLPYEIRKEKLHFLVPENLLETEELVSVKCKP